MGLFQQLEGDAAVLVSKGVYKQVPLYSRDGVIYAKANGGFIKLNLDGSTSKADHRLDTLAIEAALFKGKFGWLRIDKSDGACALSGRESEKLLLGVTP